MGQNNQNTGQQNDTGFPQSWYPVSRSCDLKKGQHKVIKLFGHNWLLFRSHQGKAAVMERRCQHMGADLAQGKVLGNTIQCPLHGWRYDSDGECVHIPDYDDKLPRVKLHSLVCEEHYGLIFAYWGKKPLFPVPQPPHMTGSIASSPALTTRLDTDYLSLSMNTFDTQHFERIHNRRYVRPPDIVSENQHVLSIHFEVSILKRRWIDFIMSWLITDTSTVKIECWGGNLILFTNFKLESAGLIALQPVDNEHSQAYLVALKKPNGKESIFDKLKMNIAVYLIKGFLMPDIQATRMMRPFKGTLIHSLDYGAEKFWDYWKQLPRHSINQKAD